MSNVLLKFKFMFLLSAENSVRNNIYDQIIFNRFMELFFYIVTEVH